MNRQESGSDRLNIFLPFLSARLLCVVAVLVGLAPNCQVAFADCVSAPAGLVGWWPGDGNANNVLGTNNGTLQGGATANATGMVGMAFNFDGTNGYVSIPDSPVFRPTNFTIEAWVKLDGMDSPGTANAGVQFFVFKQNSRANFFEGFWLGKSRSTGTDQFVFGVSSAAGAFVPVRSATIQTGVWYHVAAVRGPDYIQLYTNGQFAAQATVNFPQDYGNQPLYFGTSGQPSYDAKMKGELDEVSIYDRVLSSNEIAAIFLSGSEGKCKAPDITLQPQSQIVSAGSNVTFSVGATGFGTLSYQWLFNGSNVSGATAASLVLTNVQPTNAGNYVVVVANSFSSVTSQVAALTIGDNLPPLSGSIGVWGDLDNDGLVDALLAGTIQGVAGIPDGRFTRIYHNAGGGFFEPLNVSLPQLDSASAAWGDFDNDGNLDLLLSGTADGTSGPVNITEIYRNAGSNNFTPINAGLEGLAQGSAAWVDSDNDGLPDVFVSGVATASTNWVSRIYRNNGNGTFTLTVTNLLTPPNVHSYWADYDNDGYADLLQAGSDTTYLLKNDGAGGFTNASVSIPSQHRVISPWGDFDGDGDLDFMTSSYAYPSVFFGPDYHPSFTRNDGSGGLTSAFDYSLDMWLFSASWGDIDNSGRACVVVSGWVPLIPGGGVWGSATKVYINLGNTWQEVFTLGGWDNRSETWVDYDGDGDLDIFTTGGGLTTFWNNNVAFHRDFPQPPTNLGVTFSAQDSVTLSWQAPAGTPATGRGLSYNVRVGHASGGVDTISPLADPATSRRMVDDLGNTGAAKQRKLMDLHAGTYFWSVQSIGQSFTGSPFAEEGMFTVTNSRPRISDIFNQTTEAGMPLLPIFFTVDDDETPADDLQLFVYSSNTNLLPQTNVVLGGAGTNRSLTLAPMPLMTGSSTVTVEAHDTQDGVRSESFVFAVTSAPPQVVNQPLSQGIIVGSNVNFFITATGTAPLSYQWQKGGTNLTDGGNIGGVTNTSLTISGVQSNDAAGYRVRVSSPFGATTSAVATLTVLFPPVISTQPTNKAVPVGTSLSLSVLATGTTPLSYQWQKDGTNLLNGGQVSGATNATLSITGAQTNDVGNYSVVVTNVVGSVTSVVAAVTVLVPPAIVIQPTNQVQAVGNIVSFAVQATGDEPLSYQWQREGLPLANGGRVSGADGPVLTITNLQLSDYGAYRVVVSNPAASVTSQTALLQAFNLALAGAYATVSPARAVEFNSPYAIVADSSSGVIVVDLSNPSLPVLAGTAYTGQSASGLCLHGQYALVANNIVMALVDLSNPRSPFLAGYSATSANSSFQDVRVMGSFAYVAGSFGGLFVYDLRNPTLPVLLSTLSGTNVGSPVALQVQDGYAYLASSIPPPGGGSLGLCIISVTNPAVPVRVGLYDSPGNAQGLAVVSNLVFLADGTAGLQIVDVSNRASPLRIGGYDTPGNALGVCVTNQFAFVADDTAGVVVLDVSDPAQPVRVATYDTPGNARNVQLAGPFLLVADGIGGLQVLTGFPTAAVDLPPTNRTPAIVREPMSLTMLRSNTVSFGAVVEGSLPLSHQWYRDDALLSGVTNGWLTFSNVQPASAGLYFDVSSNAFGVVTSAVARLDVWAATNLGRYFSGGQRDSATSVDVRGQYAYVADPNQGLEIIDVSVPTNPRRVGLYSPKGGNANGVKVRGSLAYMADGAAGLDVIDVSDPVNPVRLGGFDTTGTANRLDLAWPLAYVADGTAGVQIIDVTTPSSPVRLGGYDTPGTAVNIRVANQLAYVADTTAFRILNVSNAAAPFQAGSWTNVSGGIGAGAGQVLTVTPFGTNVFLGGDNTTDVRSLNIINPSNIFHTWTYDIGSSDVFCRGSRVAADFAYAAVNTFGLLVFDVRTPATPLFAGRYDTPGTSMDVELMNGLALVADGFNGLIVLGGLPGSNAAPTMLDQPLNRTVATGTNASLSVTCDGGLPLRFQWYLNGELLAGKTNSWLAFTNTHPSNGGLYQVVAANNFGSVTSAVANFTVLVPSPKLTSPAITTNGFRFSFTSVAGVIYVVEYKDNLNTGVWTELERRFGVGGLEIVTDTTANGVMRFYRVRALYAPSPKLGAATWSGGAVNFSFATVDGAQYIVEYTDQLAPPQWNELQTISGTGNSVNFTNSAEAAPQRFFRLRVR